jgi:hypothetical protein
MAKGGLPLCKCARHKTERLFNSGPADKECRAPLAARGWPMMSAIQRLDNLGRTKPVGPLFVSR